LVECQDIRGRSSTPLHFAAGYNRLDICRFLIEEMNANVSACDKGMLQPLHNAASFGHIQIAALLIESKCDINARDVYLFTPLHEATLKRKHEVCALLIRHGADRTLKNRDGHCAVDLARHLRDQELIDVLASEQAILEAARSGDLKRLKRVGAALDGFLNVDCCETSGRLSSALHLAAGFNHVSVAEFLVERGARCDVRDRGGLAPLHNASSYGVSAFLIQFLWHFLFGQSKNQYKFRVNNRVNIHNSVQFFSKFYFDNQVH
jgi:tankyrase